MILWYIRIQKFQTLEHIKYLKQRIKFLNQKFLKLQVVNDETKPYFKFFLIPINYLKPCLKICDALRNLIPIVKFKKLEKHPLRSVNFSKFAD